MSAARGDERRDAAPESGGIDDGSGAANDALPLELVQPVGDSRPREPDLLGNLRGRRPRVLEQKVDDPKVKLIQFDGHSVNMASNRRFGKRNTCDVTDSCGVFVTRCPPRPRPLPV